jgi:tetratricopeptide (TPR) repeat protein
MHVRFFGGLEVSGVQGTLKKFASRKVALLCARMAHPGINRVSKVDISALLWPEEEFRWTLSKLRQTIYLFKKDLGVVAGDLPTLTVDRNHLAWAGELPTSDLAQFHAWAASDDPEDWRRAIELSSTPVLPDMSDEWVARVRLDVAAKRDAVLKRLAAGRPCADPDRRRPAAAEPNEELSPTPNAALASPNYPVAAPKRRRLTAATVAVGACGLLAMWALFAFRSERPEPIPRLRGTFEAALSEFDRAETVDRQLDALDQASEHLYQRLFQGGDEPMANQLWLRVEKIQRCFRLSRKKRPKQRARLAANLARMFHQRGGAAYAVDEITAALNELPRESQSESIARALVVLAFLTEERGDRVNAVQFAGRGLRAALRGTDRRLIGHAYRVRGMVLQASGEIVAGNQDFDRAERVFRAIADDGGLAITDVSRMYADAFPGESRETHQLQAATAGLRALKTFARLGHRYGIGLARFHLEGLIGATDPKLRRQVNLGLRDFYQSALSSAGTVEATQLSARMALTSVHLNDDAALRVDLRRVTLASQTMPSAKLYAERAQSAFDRRDRATLRTALEWLAANQSPS